MRSSMVNNEVYHGLELGCGKGDDVSDEAFSIRNVSGSDSSDKTDKVEDVMMSPAAFPPSSSDSNLKASITSFRLAGSDEVASSLLIVSDDGRSAG